MRIVIVSCLSMLAAMASSCSRQPADQEVDVNAAAAKAQRDIAKYAAASRPGRHADASPRIAAPVGETMPEAAVTVVRRYFRLIAAHDYRDARDLWCEDGVASGLGDRAFADSYARYARYTVKIGPVGSIDTGAGQLHVAVPVRVSGTLRNGRRFSREGTMMLHRVNDGIETRDAESHLWRIRSSSVEPAMPPVAIPRRSADRRAGTADNRGPKDAT